MHYRVHIELASLQLNIVTDIINVLVKILYQKLGSKTKVLMLQVASPMVILCSNHWSDRWQHRAIASGLGACLAVMRRLYLLLPCALSVLICHLLLDVPLLLRRVSLHYFSPKVTNAYFVVSKQFFVLHCRSCPKYDNSRHFDPHFEEVRAA